MMRPTPLFVFSFLTALSLTGSAFAQSQPSIEMNQDALKGLSGAPSAPSNSIKTTTSMDGAIEPTNPAISPEGARNTVITPGKPRLVWVKGPDGQQVPMKPDKPRKKRVKKPAPAATADAGKQCPCPPGEAEKPVAVAPTAAPVAPVETIPTPPPPPPPPAGAVVPTPPPPPPAAPADAVPPPPPPPPAGAIVPTPPPPAPADAVPPPPPPPPAGAVVPTPPAAAAPPPPPPVAITPPAPPPAVAPAAAPAPAAATPPAAPATGAPIPSTATPTGKPAYTIAFTATETALPLTMKEQMDKLVTQLKGDEKLRANIVAYASAAADQASTARRVSLSRALSVRAYLIDNGVSNLRINVQAEGDKNPGGAPDRVDIFVVQ